MPDSGRRQPEHLTARGTPLMFPQRGHRHWLWPRLNAPDGAGCSLTRLEHPRAGSGAAVSMHLMVPDAPLACSYRVMHTRDGITQHNTAHNGLIPPLCANNVALFGALVCAPQGKKRHQER